MSGLLLVEGEDIEPKHYKARRQISQHLEKTHPLKDEIEIRLIRHALRKKLPILGICRGSQLMNVVCGGTLYGDVQKEKKSRLKHINFDHYDTYRHPISIVPGSPLQKWYGRTDAAREQLPSSGDSRSGSAIQAHGARGGRTDRGLLRSARQIFSWASSFIPSACWKKPPATGASGKRSAMQFFSGRDCNIAQFVSNSEYVCQHRFPRAQIRALSLAAIHETCRMMDPPYGAQACRAPDKLLLVPGVSRGGRRKGAKD